MQGCNPLNGALLKSKRSKSLVIIFFIVSSCYTAITLKNAFRDFSGDIEKQFSALIVFFGMAQVTYLKLNILIIFKYFPSPQLADLQNVFTAFETQKAPYIESTGSGR